MKKGYSHGVVVKADGSRSRGRGFGTAYWIDVSDANYCKHENNKNKDSRMGHTTNFF